MLSNPLKIGLVMIFYKTSSVRIIAHFGKLGKLKIIKNLVSASYINGLVEYMDIAEHFRSKFKRRFLHYCCI